MKKIIFLLIALLLPVTAQAQLEDPTSDMMLCMMAQQYSTSLKTQPIAIDAKVSMTGLGVDCVNKVVQPQLKAAVTQAAAHANPQYNDDWKSMYCKGQGIYRVAADAGWKVSAQVQYTDGAEQINVVCN